MADFTTVGLLASIRRRAMLATATATGTADADLLALANEELQLRLSADVMRVREEYLVHTIDQTISASQTKYRIPSRAAGAALRDVMLVNAAGGVCHLPRISPERMEEYLGGGTGTYGYYLQGNYVVLVPAADAAAPTLRMSLAVRPSELTATATNFGTITAINTTTKVVTFSGSIVPSVSTVLDLVAHRNPFEPLAIEQTPSAVAGADITFSALPAGLEVGNYVTLRDLSPVPQVPQEYHSILAQRTAVKVLEALGDFEGMAVAQAALEDMEQKVLALVTPRVQGSPQKIINRSAFIRGGGSRFARSRYWVP